MTLQEENEKLRELLRDAVIYLKKWNRALGHQYGCEEEDTLIESIDSFLSQQTEPAPAQDERGAFANRFPESTNCTRLADLRDGWIAGLEYAARPAQTAPQTAAKVPCGTAVVSEQEPTINSAIKRLDVAQEYAGSKRERWPDMPLLLPSLRG